MCRSDLHTKADRRESIKEKKKCVGFLDLEKVYDRG